MNLVPSGKNIFFEYSAFDKATTLFVAMKVFDLSLGAPGVLVATVPAVHVVGGTYVAPYNFADGKPYLTRIMVYTDVTYLVELDPYTPSSTAVYASNFADQVNSILTAISTLTPTPGNNFTELIGIVETP